MNDPRLKLLMDETTKIMVQSNYDPHYANIAERILYENLLFLARYDMLMKFYNEQVVDITKVPGV